MTAVFSLAQVYNCCKAKERQDKILEVLSDSETTLNSHDRDVINYSDSSVVDSNFLNKRNSLQSSKKDTIVFLEKENKDPELNTSPNITSTIENIEKLLHLEIAKIEEERTCLTLWIGIITVVFLIFSFYSLLNSEKLLKKGQDDVVEIRGLKKEVRDEVRFLNESYIYYTKRMEDDLERVTEKKDDIIKDFQEKVDDLEYRYIAMFDDYFDKIKDKFEKKRNELETELDALNENINILSEIFKTVEEKFNKNEDNFNKVLLSNTEEASNNKQQSTNNQEFGEDIDDSEEDD